MATPSFEVIWTAAQAATVRGARPRLRMAGAARRRPRRLLALTTSGAVLTATIVLVLGLDGGGPTSAFAGWTAVPTKPVRGEIAAAASRCGQDGAPTLADTRGPFELMLFEQPDQPLELCKAWPTGASSFGSVAQAVTASPSSTSISTAACLTGGSNNPAYTSWREIYGYVGADVASVTLTLSDGSTVQATASNGLWAAWWPGSQTMTSAQVTTTTGASSSGPLQQSFPGCGL
jgi:hypothetical protein